MGLSKSARHYRGATANRRDRATDRRLGESGRRTKKGQRFGMIRFGSRTEVYLPLDAEILVKVGDHVTGGASVIARLPE